MKLRYLFWSVRYRSVVDCDASGKPLCVGKVVSDEHFMTVSWANSAVVSAAEKILNFIDIRNDWFLYNKNGTHMQMSKSK